MKLKPKIALSSNKRLKLDDKDIAFIAFGHYEEPRKKKK